MTKTDWFTWLAWWIAIGGSGAALYVGLDRYRRYLPQAWREYVGLYCEGDSVTCDECGRRNTLEVFEIDEVELLYVCECGRSEVVARDH